MTSVAVAMHSVDTLSLIDLFVNSANGHDYVLCHSMWLASRVIPVGKFVSTWETSVCRILLDGIEGPQMTKTPPLPSRLFFSCFGKRKVCVHL